MSTEPEEDSSALVPAGRNALEPAPLETLDVFERSRIDLQISAAKAHPRAALEVIDKRILTRATRSIVVAELCYYSLPRYDKEKKKNILIHGASIKLANIALGEWGNTLSGAYTTGNDGAVVRARGVCWDLETNNQKFAEVQRRILDKNGRLYSYDMQIVTAQAANSIAERNAILKVLGSDLYEPVVDECLRAVAGTSKDLIERRDKALKWFNLRGVKHDQILEMLDKDRVDQLDVDDVAYLSGLANAIKDKAITVDDAFSPETEEDRAQGGKKSRLREMAEQALANKEK